MRRLKSLTAFGQSLTCAPLRHIFTTYFCSSFKLVYTSHISAEGREFILIV